MDAAQMPLLCSSLPTLSRTIVTGLLWQQQQTRAEKCSDTQSSAAGVADKCNRLFVMGSCLILMLCVVWRRERALLLQQQLIACDVICC